MQRLSEKRRRYVRYAMASAASLVVSQGTLFLAFGIVGWSAVTSNVASFVVATAFAYEVQRRWTWRRRGTSSVRREVIPFWVIATVGLVASTAAVRWASMLAAEHVASRAVQAVVVVAASTATYGLLWVVKFLLFDRLLFTHTATERAP